jgi:predicted DNA-binding transcriptional regulator YafY
MGLMRADRLLSLLMLLQSRGRMTARVLARQLEVSERTIYRDIDALSAAGVPVYGEPGRDGGFALIDRYRTNLTGLTDGELQALFVLSIPMLSNPGPLAELGLGQELRGALLKLSASLPDVRRETAAWARPRIYIDPSGWEHAVEPVPHLQTLYQAVRQDRCVRINYRPLFQVRLDLLIEPYGLVAKAGAWYLVYASKGRLRVQPLSGLIDVQMTEETFLRSEGFELANAWEEWCSARAYDRAGYPVSVRVSPAMLPFLPMYFGPGIRERVAESDPPDPQGWITLDLSFESHETARDRLLSFGSAVEVIAPPALRLSIQDYGQQIAALYTRPMEE